MICAKVLTVAFGLPMLGYSDHVREAITGQKTQRDLSEIERTVTQRNIKGLSCDVFWQQDAHLYRDKAATAWAVVPRDLSKTGVIYKTCLPCHASPVASLQLINQLPDMRTLRFKRWLRNGDPT